MFAIAAGVRTWLQKTEKLASPSACACSDRYRGGRGRGLESDREEHYLALRLLPGDAQRIRGRVHHAHVGAAGLRLHEAHLSRRRHPHHVAVGAQGHAALERESDRRVHAPDRQHAHRAARAVDHAQVGGQQPLDTVARDGVGMAAAELHEVVAAVGPDRGAQCPGEPARQSSVAEFVDVFHGVAASRAMPPISAKSSRVRRASSSSSFCSA